MSRVYQWTKSSGYQRNNDITFPKRCLPPFDLFYTFEIGARCTQQGPFCVPSSMVLLKDMCTPGPTKVADIGLLTLARGTVDLT